MSKPVEQNRFSYDHFYQKTEDKDVEEFIQLCQWIQKNGWGKETQPAYEALQLLDHLIGDCYVSLGDYIWEAKPQLEKIKEQIESTPCISERLEKHRQARREIIEHIRWARFAPIFKFETQLPPQPKKSWLDKAKDLAHGLVYVKDLANINFSASHFTKAPQCCGEMLNIEGIIRNEIAAFEPKLMGMPEEKIKAFYSEMGNKFQVVTSDALSKHKNGICEQDILVDTFSAVRKVFAEGQQLLYQFQEELNIDVLTQPLQLSPYQIDRNVSDYKKEMLNNLNFNKFCPTNDPRQTPEDAINAMHLDAFEETKIKILDNQIIRHITPMDQREAK